MICYNFIRCIPFKIHQNIHLNVSISFELGISSFYRLSQLKLYKLICDASVKGANRVIFHDMFRGSLLALKCILAHIISWSESKVFPNLMKSGQNEFSRFQHLESIRYSSHNDMHNTYLDRLTNFH